MLVGYARVSSNSQSLDIQLDALQSAGCEKVFQEKRTGTDATKGLALNDALDFVREGDTLVITRLDRLARSSVDLHNIIARLAAKGVGFRCLQQSGIDTASGTGKLVLAILGAVAEFETDIRRERQREGIDKAKAKGVYKGRKPTIDNEAIVAMKAEGVRPVEIARKLGIARASVYRALSGNSSI